MSIPQCLQGTTALYKMIFLILLFPIFSHAQVRLNEVSGDTGNNDSTNDGILELAGAPGTDIGCYVISNSEWTVVLPPNTKIPADGVFLIACSEGKNIGNNPNPVVGSGLTCALCDFPNMPIDFDVCNPTNAAYIDWAASGFTIDNAAATDGDQIVLFSPSGTVVDAVQWGGGSTNIPTDNTTLSTSRGNQNYTIGNATWNGEGNPALPPVALKMGGTCFQSGINYVMPAIFSGKYTDLTNLPFLKSINSDVQKGCNSSFMFDAVTNKWVKTDHPNPGFPTNIPYDDFMITGNLTQCSNALSPITVTWKVLNWQSVEESTVNDFGRIGSFWQQEGTGISNAWTNISRNNVTGITTLVYTFTPTATTTYNFVWQDRVEHTIASSENGSGLIGAVVSGSTLSDCYEVKTIHVKVADPMAATQTTITCPTDNPKGTINLANFVTGGLALNYKLFSNGVEISSNNTGVFALPTSLANPIKATISDASGCTLPVTITIDASCKQAPICPNTIVTTGSTPSGSVCVDDEISLCMSGINLPAGGSVQWYYSTTSATFSPASGTLIGNADIPNPTTGTTTGHPGGGVCPVIDGVMVDACNGSTTEKDNEFLILRNGSAALNVDNIAINLPASTDIKTTANNEFAPYAGVNSPLGGCFTVIDDGATIPADAVVIIFMSNLLSQTYDFTSLCAAYGTVYVLFRNPSTAAFSNSAKAIRNTILSVKNNTTCTATYTYQNAAKPSSGTTDGTFYRFPLPLAGKATSATALNNGCSAPPVTAAPATPPCVNFTIPAALCGNSAIYIRPLITPVDAACPSGSNTTAALSYTLSCPKANISGNTTICAPNTGSATITVTNGIPNKNITGKIIRASDAVTTNFIGSTNASGNATITVNALATGDYELNMMTISGSSCAVQFSGAASVKVNPAPNIAFSNATTNVCQGLLAEIPVTTTGTLPFDIVYNLNGGTATKLSVFSPTLYIPIPSGMTGMVTLTIASVADETGCVGTITGTGKINIIAPPNAPTGTNTENCWSSGTTNLTFTANAGANTVNWYDTPIGEVLLGTGTSFMVSSFTPIAPFPQTITRYAETVDAATGCISATRTLVTVTIQQKPSITLEKSDPTCAAPSSGSIKITTTPSSGKYNYQKAATYTAGILSPDAALSSPIKIDNLEGSDYTVRVFNTNTCFSDKSIALPTPTDCFTCPNIGAVSGVNMVCKGNPLTLTASGLTNMAIAGNGETDFGIKFVYFSSPKTGNTMYNAPDGTLGTVPFAQISSGNAVLNNAILPSTTGSYYIYAILDPLPNVTTCRPSMELLVKVNDTPSITFSSTTTNVCQGLLAEIPITTTGTLPFDMVYNLNGGTAINLSVVSNKLSIPIPSGMTGMVTLNVVSVTDKTGCVGTITGSGKINVIAPPAAPTGINSENCWSSGTTNLTFSANSGANTINWYDAPVAGTLLGTGTSFLVASFTPIAPFPQTITRYAETVDAATGCISATRTPVTVTIQQKPSITLEKSDPTCAAPSSGSIKITTTPSTSTYNYQKATTYTAGILSPDAALASPVEMKNMAGGDYTVRVFNTNTCFSDKSIALPTPTGCFTCPTIGAVSGVNMVCKGKPLTLTASGLVNMSMASNGETDFGIKFVYFSSPKTGNAMYNAPDGTLGTVPFAQISGGNAVLNNAILPSATGFYYIYAIIDPAPTTSASCRPYQELLVKVNDAPAPLVNNETLCQNGSVTITPNPIQPISIVYNFDVKSAISTKSGAGAMLVTGFDAGLGGGIIGASSGLYQIGNPSSGLSMVLQGFTANGTAADAVANSDFIDFVVGGNDGYTVNITNIEFDVRRSGTGPTHFDIRTSNDLFTNVVGTGTVPTTFGASPMRTFAVNIPMTAAGTSIRIYPYGATGATGTFRMDNVKFTGTVRTTATYNFYSDAALTTKIADQISAFTFNNTATSGDKKIWTTCISPQGCESVSTESTVTINPLPTVKNATLTLCEDVSGSGKAVFTLSNANSSIATGNISISYFASLADAQANISPLSNIYNSISKKIYARIIDNVTSCLNFSELQLTVVPRANAGIAPPSITLCANGNPVNLFNLLSGSPTTNGIWSGASALSGGSLGTCDPTKIVTGIYTYTIKGISPCPDATAQIEVKIMPTTLACSSGINTALPSTGTLQITPQMVVHGDYPDYSLFKVDVFDKSGNLLPNATVTKEQAGTKINIAVTNTCSNGVCYATALLEDKAKPVCEKLMDYTLPCTVDIATAKPTPSDFKVEPLDADSVRQDRSTYSKDFTGLYIFKGEIKPTRVKISVVGSTSDDVIFTDNAGIASIYFVDVIQDYGCTGKAGNPTILKEITRQWRIVDINGNVQNCSQVIAIQTVTNIGCPADVTLECEDADLALKLMPEGGENKAGDKVKGAGAPFMDSNKNGVKDTYREPYIYPENKAMMCKFTATYVDKRYDLCKNSYKIIRTWQVFNECAKTISTCSQTISVLDTKAPDITADEKNTILDSDGNECAYIGKLNFFNIKDKSGVKYDETRIAVKNLATGKTNIYINDGLSRLARGAWEITVTAKDSCGNIGSKTFERTVRDRQAPIMICQDNIRISLNNLSVTNICARTFNHASRDNCSDIQFKVAKSETQTIDFQKLTYKDCLDFSCVEVGKPPIIFLRGMDADSNFNYCMVRMQVDDKIPPTCNAPADMKISCGEYKNWKNSGEWNERKWGELFGNFKYFEACDADISEKIEEKLPSNCTAGELLRTFTVTERYGAKRSATCTQRIEITPKQDFVVSFPLNKNVACAEPPKEKPRVTTNGCENVQIAYKDEIFRPASQVFEHQSGKYCYKIIRHWSVINMCRYNPTRFNYLPEGDADVIYTDKLKDTIFYGKYWIDDMGTEANDNALYSLKNELYAPLKDVTNSVVFANKIDKPYLSFYPNLINGTRKFGAIIDGKTDTTAIQIRDYSGDGVIRYTQIINIIDNDAPIFAACPKEIIEAGTGEGFGTDCMADASLSITATDKCTPSDSIQYSFVIKLYGKNQENTIINGKNKHFLDKLPITKSDDAPHEITWSAQDICGNVATCSYKFRVSDKKMPTVLTRNIYTQVMDKENITIPVSKFVLSASDNCTPQNRLRFSFSPDVKDTLKTLTCSDIPIVKAKIYVTDESKNQNFSTSEINLIDSNYPKVCDPERDIIVTGSIFTESNLVVQANIQLSMDNEQSAAYKTEQKEAFSWNVPRRKDYFLTPKRTGDWMNGVSTFDLVLMQKHILDIEKLSSPYKIIAADINNDHRLTTLDIIELRKNILKISNGFQNNTSWRFIQKNYAFKDAENPLDEQIPEQYRFPTLEKDVKADFIAMKIGDVSDNAYGNFPENRVAIAEERGGEVSMRFFIEDKAIRKGDLVTVLFKADEVRTLAGFQMDLQFDKTVLRFEKMLPHSLPLTERNFGTFDRAITMSWHDANGVKIGKGEVLFAFVFTATQDTRLREALWSSKNFIKSEAYIIEKNEPIVVPLLLEIQDDATLRNENILHQNTPNPFKNETTLHFYLTEAQNVTIRITDATGKNIATIQKYYDKGENEVLLQDFPEIGVYFYHLETASYRATRKMVKVR